jgi:hypothetical protein
MTMSSLKRWTVQLHLYLGSALCALFVVWFVSGVVMMYHGYPGLTAAERFAAMPALDCARCVVPPAEAVRLAGLPAGARQLRLGMYGSRPVWRIADDAGRWHAAYADRAEPLHPLTPRASEALAAAFVGPGARGATFAGTLDDADQWTLTRSVRDQMPLHRVDVLDPAGVRVYIAPASAEVVSASTRRERLWSWLGAIPHWIYPTVLRRHAETWAWLVIGLSGLGTLMSLAGLAIGAWQWRWRRRERPDGRVPSRTPYRDRMMRWHHGLGLGFGAVACTWVFSGLMSMNPGDWSPGGSPTADQRRQWSGGPVVLESLTVAPAVAWQAMRDAGRMPRELRPLRLGGTHFWSGSESPHRAVRVRATPLAATAAPPAWAPPAVDSLWPTTALVERTRALLPAAHLVEATVLTTYDAYYRDPERQRPLPVVRVVFDDPERSWLYLDPQSGEIAQRHVWRSRLERWLYDGLHTFDFAWLVSRRPLWDVLLVFLSLGGVLLSATGVVLSWRYARALGTGQRRYRRR